MAKTTKTGVKVIKDFFEEGEHGRKVKLKELKALKPEERKAMAAEIEALEA